MVEFDNNTIIRILEIHLIAMKNLFALLLCLGMTCCLLAQAPNMDYDPDWDGDGSLGVSDLLGFLALFGDFDTDGDGIWDSVDDCTDVNACNFDSNPSVPCNFIDAIGICGGWCEVDEDSDGMCDWVCGVDSIEFDGDWYHSVQIGGQCWFQENLRSKHFVNLEPIPYNPSVTDWAELTTGACCAYQYDDSTSVERGLLYNLYAVLDSRGLCPSGWHTPTDEEFIELEAHLGLPDYDWYDFGVRGNEEEIGMIMMDSIAWIGNNNSEFSAVASGWRRENGDFPIWGSAEGGASGTLFWTASVTSNAAISRLLSGATYAGSGAPAFGPVLGIGRLGGPGNSNYFGVNVVSSPRMGKSIRCLKD